MIVRDARAADAGSIADVHIMTWQEAYRGQLPQELLDRLPESFDRRVQLWRRIAEARGERGSLLVAENDDGRVLGFAHVDASRDDDADAHTGEVKAIYLRQSNWGQGLGRALFEEATNRLRKAGFKRATLWVLASNDRTRRFYEAAGWRLDGAEKADHVSGVPLQELRYSVEL